MSGLTIIGKNMVLDGILWYFRTHLKKVQKNIELCGSYFAVYRQKLFPQRG